MTNKNKKRTPETVSEGFAKVIENDMQNPAFRANVSFMKFVFKFGLGVAIVMGLLIRFL